MATSQNPLIGRSKGKLGGVVLSKWKDKNTIRTKPIEVSNPKTIPQQTQRNRLTLINAASRLILSVINIGFKEKSSSQSQSNAFMSVNIINATNSAAPPVVTLVPANVLVSDGSLGLTAFTSVSTDATNDQITCSYSTSTPLSGQSGTDKVNAAIYNATTDTWTAGTTSDTRADGSATITANQDITAGDDVWVYLFFSSADGNKSGISEATQTTAA